MQRWINLRFERIRAALKWCRDNCAGCIVVTKYCNHSVPVFQLGAWLYLKLKSQREAAAPNGSDPTPPDDVGEDGEDDEDQDFDDVSGFGCGLQRDFA